METGDWISCYNVLSNNLDSGLDLDSHIDNYLSKIYLDTSLVSTKPTVKYCLLST